MWAKYTYNASVSQANLLADLVAILTGTTDKTTLSADCDQANTEILATYDVAGWTVHDASAGTNAQVLKAPCEGDAAQFKYVEINTNTAGQVFMGLWESWNETTHVGTNLAYQSKTSNYGQRYSTTLTGQVYISASSGRLMLYGVSAAGNGSANAVGAATGVIEGGRAFTWCAVGQGFTPAAFLRTSAAYSCSRHKGSDGVIYTAATVNQFFSTGFGIAQGNATFNSAGPPAALGNHLPLAAIVGQGTSTASTGAVFSDFNPSGMLAVGLGAGLDEFAYNAQTWVVWPVSATLNVIHHAVPKG
jgi:hypothetical protein